MECPYCNQELDYHDWFGTNMAHDPIKQGNIYICQNEACEMFEEHFYTRENSDEIYEGYPC